MSRKITPEMFERIIAVERIRKATPTRKQLAIEMGVSKGLVDQIASGTKLYVPRDTTTTTKLQESLVELGLAKS